MSDSITDHLYIPALHRGGIEPREDIAPGYLGKGELSCIFGASGQTKSLLAIDHACRFAARRGWNGDESDWRLPVLYIAAERPAQVKRRIEAFASATHVDEHFPHFVMVYSGPVDIAEISDQLLDIEEACRSATYYDGGAEVERWGLVVIDTLAAAMSRPVSDTTATNAAAHNLTNLARATGAHVMCVHHQPVSGEVRMSGGHLPAAMDTIIHVRKTAGGVSIASVVKDNGRPESEWVKLAYSLKSVDIVCRDGSIISEAVVAPKLGGAEREDDPDQPQGGDPTPVRLSASQREVLAALSGALAEHGDAVTMDLWRQRANAVAPAISEDGKRKRFDRAAQALQDRGIVKRSGNFCRLSGSDNSDVSGPDNLSGQP